LKVESDGFDIMVPETLKSHPDVIGKYHETLQSIKKSLNRIRDRTTENQ